MAISFNVRGVSFRKENLNKIIKNSIEEKDMSVALVPEPTNKYDKNAIMVIIDDLHVGYVPKENCELISLLLDANRIKSISFKILNGDYQGIKLFLK